ncbi:alpha/beta hydrolase [Xylariaceae sp. FL1272]|nr:alpha/beta hydrolase [Xylariaceae sp. FL1272]
MASRENQTLKLPDGRTLGFAEYGSPTGKPLFIFHGFPSCRVEAASILKLSPRKDQRIIAPERPGFGLSSFDPQRRITDWPEDVRALADHLGISRFAILGGSGGGPFAVACANALPAEMMSAVGLMASAGPWVETRAAGVPIVSRMTAWLSFYLPSAARALCWGVVGMCRWLATSGPVTRRLDKWIESTAKPSKHPSSSPSTSAAPPAPRTTQQRREDLIRLAFEPFRQGVAPTVREAKQLTWEGWGFPLENVAYDKIIIWHGSKDWQSPIGAMRYLAERLPHCELSEFKQHTHFTLYEEFGDILETLVPEDKEEGKKNQ